jgi:hypothetical protein
MDRHYDHPILMLQHMIWHEGYHHGQIKLALKLAGRAISDKQAGHRWRKTAASAKENERCAEVAAMCERFCMWWPEWRADTTRTLQRLRNGWRPKENLKK